MQYVLKKNMWKNRSPFFKVSSSTLAIVETISLSFLFIFCLKQYSKALLKSSTVLSKIGPTSICEKASCSLLLAIFWFALWKKRQHYWLLNCISTLSYSYKQSSHNYWKQNNFAGIMAPLFKINNEHIIYLISFS